MMYVFKDLLSFLNNPTNIIIKKQKHHKSPFFYQSFAYIRTPKGLRTLVIGLKKLNHPARKTSELMYPN